MLTNINVNKIKIEKAWNTVEGNVTTQNDLSNKWGIHSFHFTVYSITLISQR